MLIARFLGVALLFLIAVGAASDTASSYFFPCKEPEKARNQGDIESRRGYGDCTTFSSVATLGIERVGGLIDLIDRKHDAVTTIATIFIAAFTIILGFATWFLWRSTDKLVRGAEDTSERELRAYVGVSLAQHPEGLNPVFEIMDGPWILFEIRNYGKTPAHKVTHWLTTALGPPNFTGPFPDGSKEAGDFPTTLQPSGWLQTGSRGPKPLAGQPEAWFKGELVAFAWGEVHYIDAFERQRWAKFRYTYGARDLGGKSVGVRLCKEGNEAN